MEITFSPIKGLNLLSNIEDGDFQKIKKISPYFYKGMNIHLDSPGGDLAEAIESGHFLEKFNPIIHVYEKASSSALFLLISGKKRTASKESTFLFHTPLNAETNEPLYELIPYMANIISKYTHLSAEEVISLIHQNKRMNSEEALHYGLIHEISKD